MSPTPHHINAEMVANVLQVLVEPGARIEAGDTVVLLESMKMEIPVLSEWGGTVTEVPVQPGDVVLRIGNKSIHSPADFQAGVAEAKKGGRSSVLLLVAHSQGGTGFVAAG